jgi:imidazole glycerol-phosphate synthase subunit HisF
MLTKRVIPTMLCRGRTLVKGKQFAGDRSIGHILQAARVYAARGVDELVILDIGATAEGRGPDLGMVRELTAGCFIPVTVGGGVKTLSDIDALLRAGADKVCIGMSGWENGVEFVRSAADRFGKQAIVLSVDHRQGVGYLRFGMAAEFCGAGEILLQAVERDGMMCGYDLDAIRSVSNAVSVPVIASGGCSSYQDMLEAIHVGADAVAAGALFAFTDATPRGAAKFLADNGVAVRQ